MPATYTPSTGLTPAGQQLATGQPNAANTQAPANAGNMMAQIGSGQELSPTQLSGLTGAYGNAATQAADMQTSDARQGYVNNSNIPGMQQNYEDLAKKLFDYDQGNLAPQFQGQNPGMPGDAASFGRVDASPLAMTMAAAGLPASQGLSIASNNPKYAYATQAAQGNNIVDLLDTLNKSIGGEFNLRAGTYKNTVDKQMTLLKSISDILGMNQETSLKNKELQTQKELEHMRLGAQYAQMAQEKQLKLIEMGYVDPTTGELYKGSDGKPSLKTPQDYADAFRGGYVKWAEVPSNMKIAVGSLVKKQGGDVQKINESFQGLNNSLSVLNKIEGDWNKMNDLEKRLPSGIASMLPGAAATRTEINSLFFNALEPELRKASLGGRITQQEINWIKDSVLPGPMDTQESALNKLNGVKYGLQQKLKNPQYILGSDTLDESKYSGGSQSSSTSGVNRQDVIGKLKSAGYTDDLIHAYLRKKGIDQ
jgi:hypothetical protein